MSVQLSLLLLASLNAMANGRAPSWPQAMHGPSRSGHAPGITPVDSCAVAWTFNMTFSRGQESSASVSVSPVVDGDGFVYMGTGLGVLYKLDGSTGEQVWSFNANKTGVATWGPDIAIGVKGQSAYFVVQDKLTAVDTATGKETWHFEVGDTEIFHTLTVGETGVIFVTALEHVYAIDPADGQQIWNVTFKSNFRGAAIAVDGTTRLAYFGSVGCTAVTATESCTIVGLDQATGRQLTETNALGNVGDLFLFPLASGKGGSLFIRRRPQGNQTQLDCIAADGALSWTFSCPSGTGVEGFVTESDFIIVGCSGGSIHGLETRRGVEKWNVSDLYGSKVVAMAGPSTVLFSGANHFAAMDIEGLQPLWNCTTPGDATQYLAALGDKGRMYIPSYVRNDFVTLYGAAGHTTSRVKHKMLAIILAVSAAVGVTSFVLFATYFYRKRRHRYRVIQ